MVPKAVVKTGSAGLAAAGLALLTACGGDPAGPSEDLSAGEAAAISEVMVSSAFEGWAFEDAQPAASRGVAPSASAGGSGEPVEFDIDVEASSDCPQGGGVSVAGAIQGTIDDETQSGNLSLDISVSAASCTFPAEGTVFTVDTNPELVLTGNFAWQSGAPVGEQTFSYTGTLVWSAEDGRSGSCAIDLTVTRSESGVLTESGTVCGFSLDELE